MSKNHLLYLELILLLAGDKSLNPGPVQNDHLLKENWKSCKNKDIYFTHLNINIFVSKIDKLSKIAKIPNAVVTGITESKPRFLSKVTV